MTERLFLKKVCIDFDRFQKVNRLAIIPYIDEDINELKKEIWVELMLGSSPLYVHFKNISFCNNQAIYEADEYTNTPPQASICYASTIGE